MRPDLITTHDTEQEPPLTIPPHRWRCCRCGGTGVVSYGDTCELCDGLGFC
ncbi:MAG: hypothetical protein JWQ95_6623 [Sphaerisporangium sp.]|nr:hypothetical protein [Sphaerisporangium sp.]